jgi:hypothetical protein
MDPRPREHDVAPVSWDQVRAFRLGRHHLVERASPRSLTTVVGDITGAQAQLLSAAQMSIWARVRDLTPEMVESALWNERSLTKAWCMRRTLFLVPSHELATFVRGSARRAEKEIRWILNRGVSERNLDRVLGATLTMLDRPVTRTQLAERVSRSLGLRLRWARGGGWGSQRKVACVQVGSVTCPVYFLLHLLGARAVFCSGPNQGNEPSFVRADRWLPAWTDLSPDRAEEQLLRKYLGAFGPATPSDFALWSGMRLTDAKGIWARQEAEVARVNIEGWPAWVLRQDLSPLQEASLSESSVRMLPFFDSFLLGHTEREHLVPKAHHLRVYRPQGWVAPVVLVDGRVKGVWSYVCKGERLRVGLDLFGSVPRALSATIREESRDLARFLGCSEVQVTRS